MARKAAVLGVAVGLLVNDPAAGAEDAHASINGIIPQQPGKTACFAGSFDNIRLDSVEWIPPTSGQGPSTAVYHEHRPNAFVLQLEYERARPLADAKDYPGYDRRYEFLLLARLRDRRGPLYAAGECRWLNHDFVSADGKLRIDHNTTQLYCGIECDGGGMALERINDKDALVLRIAANHELRMTPPCGGEDKSIAFAARDTAKEFALAARAPAACRPLQRWIRRKR